MLNVECASLWYYVRLCYAYNISYSSSRIDWISFGCAFMWHEFSTHFVKLWIWFWDFLLAKIIMCSMVVRIYGMHTSVYLLSFVCTCTQFSSTFIYLLFHVRYHNSFLYSLPHWAFRRSSRPGMNENFQPNKKCRSNILAVAKKNF